MTRHLSRVAGARRRLAGFLVVLTATAWGAAQEDVANGSFEALRGSQISGWSIPSYWQGTLAPAAAPGEARSGARAARVAATSRGGQWAGRILASPRLDVHLGRPYRFSAWAKGSGSLRLGVIRYRPEKPGQVSYVYLWQPEPATLTSDWQEVSLEYTIWEPEFERLALCIEVLGESAVALVDEVGVRARVAPGVQFELLPAHPLVAAGQAAEFGLELRGAPASGPVQLFTFPVTGEALRRDLALSAAGRGVIAWPPTATQVGLWRLVAAQASTGATAEAWVDVLPPAEFARFEAAAARLPLPPGRLHLLVIGDSLTDFNRGCNYVDKLGFWLRQRGGERCTVRNVGVGGDDIVRVWQRLNRTPGTHRQEMYDGLLEPLPTHILVFLGHNDSKATSRSQYTEHAVSPEAFADHYRQTLERLKADTGAHLTVVSATSSVYAITKATADQRAAAGTGHNLFGKPEHLERFNAIAQRVAAEVGAAYLDVYGPTRDHPDKPSLFTGDGVHLSPAGHRFLAQIMLEGLFRPAPAGG